MIMYILLRVVTNVVTVRSNILLFLSDTRMSEIKVICDAARCYVAAKGAVRQYDGGGDKRSRIVHRGHEVRCCISCCRSL